MASTHRDNMPACKPYISWLSSQAMDPSDTGHGSCVIRPARAILIVMWSVPYVWFGFDPPGPDHRIIKVIATVAHLDLATPGGCFRAIELLGNDWLATVPAEILTALLSMFALSRTPSIFHIGHSSTVLRSGPGSFAKAANWEGTMERERYTSMI